MDSECFSRDFIFFYVNIDYRRVKIHENVITLNNLYVLHNRISIKALFFKATAKNEKYFFSLFVFVMEEVIISLYHN